MGRKLVFSRSKSKILWLCSQRFSVLGFRKSCQILTSIKLKILQDADSWTTNQKSKFQSELKAMQTVPHFFNNKLSILTNYFADLPNRVWKSVDYYYATQTTPWAISTPKNSYKNVWILLPGEERRGLIGYCELRRSQKGNEDSCEWNHNDHWNGNLRVRSLIRTNYF